MWNDNNDDDEDDDDDDDGEDAVDGSVAASDANPCFMGDLRTFG